MRSCSTCGNLYEDVDQVCGRDGTRLGAPDSLLGQVLGGYQLTSIRGRGGMGTVYVGKHPEREALVAVKVLAARFAHRPELVERFRTESVAVAQIRHQNIIEFYDSGVLPDGRPYYVMELLDGEDLASYLRRIGWISAGEAIHMVAEVLDGIAVAHSAGIVHRDLKPENLFVARRPDGTRVMRILDFGVAKLMDAARLTASASGQSAPARRTLEGAVVGSGPYMAPEQAAGRVHEIGPATDLFTLGVVLYLMLTGNYPFKQMGGLPAFHRPPEPPSHLVPGIPPGIDELLSDMLTINPTTRARHANAVAHALRSIAPDLPPVGAADGANAPHPAPGGAMVHVPTVATEVPAGLRVGLVARDGIEVQPGLLRPEAPTLKPTPAPPASVALAQTLLAAPSPAPAPQATPVLPTPAVAPSGPTPVLPTPAVPPPPDATPILPATSVIRSGSEVMKAAAPMSLKELSIMQKGPAAWTSQIIRIKKVERSSSSMMAAATPDAPRQASGGWTYAILGVVLTALAVAAIFYIAMR